MHTKKVEIKHISIQLGCRNRDSTERSRWQPSGNKTIFLADKCFEDRLKKKKDEIYRPLKLPQGECKARWWAAHKNDGQKKKKKWWPGQAAGIWPKQYRQCSSSFMYHTQGRDQSFFAAGECEGHGIITIDDYSGIYSAIGCLIIMFDMWCLLYWAT